MVKCIRCGSDKLYTRKPRTRQVYMLDGSVKTTVGTPHHCKSCNFFFMLDKCKLAPKGSKYSWEVIEEIYRLRRKGLKLREISGEILEHGLSVSPSQVWDIVNRYKNQLREAEELDRLVRISIKINGLPPD